jgi:hypothetical protein
MAKSAKSPKESETQDTTKASFLLKTALLKKLRYISVVDEITQTDIIDQLLTKYVNDWEKKNGEIPAKQ